MNFRPAVAALLFCLVLLPVSLDAASQPEAARSDNSEAQFGSSITLFTTLAAINMAGYDDGIDSPLNQTYRVRTQVRQELAKKNIPCLGDLRAFYLAHKLSSPSEDLGQYISFALVVGDPPMFELPQGQLPPGVDPLRDFSALLARFYKEADIPALWQQAQGAYAAAIQHYQDPVINSIFEANGYVRNSSGYLGRRFRIYLDLLGAPNEIQVRNYRDDYFIVVTPTTAPVVDEIRDAYLAYLLDPLSFKYRVVITQKRDLEKVAQQAPALDEAYKQDFSLLVTKCLIKAIDSRLMHGDSDNRTVFINQAMREGFILTGSLADLLVKYEKQEEPMRLYYPDLIDAIDVKKVEKQFRNFEFAKSAPPRVVAPPSSLQVDPAEQTFEAAEGLYEQSQFQDAQRLYRKVLEQTADKQLHGRACYRLALIAVRNNSKEEAVQLFERAAQANPDGATTAWAHVYLGRLAQAAGDQRKAAEQFKLALNVEGGSPMARRAAEEGLQSSSSGEKE